MGPEATSTAMIFLFLMLLLLRINAIELDQELNSCDLLPEKMNLKPDQITVLISGYSTYRIPVLQSIVQSYVLSPVVNSVVILWGNRSTETETLATLATTIKSRLPASVKFNLIRQQTDSLNERFLPRPELVETEAVLICDDDVEVSDDSLEFAFRAWLENRDRIVGIFARSHELDLMKRRWEYTVHREKYSIVLTKFMILKVHYLWEYTCGGGNEGRKMREIVDRMRNCEDILMNFVVANEIKAGPILVGTNTVRDWGDPRNENRGNLVRYVGLSTRRISHMKRRGQCITRFHKTLGKMPLRYRYSKHVSGVGEQALCMKKGGKWVACDSL